MYGYGNVREAGGVGRVSSAPETLELVCVQWAALDSVRTASGSRGKEWEVETGTRATAAALRCCGA